MVFIAIKVVVPTPCPFCCLSHAHIHTNVKIKAHTYTPFFWGLGPRNQSVGVTVLELDCYFSVFSLCSRVSMRWVSFIRKIKAISLQGNTVTKSLRCWPSCLRRFWILQTPDAGDSGPLDPNPQKSLKVLIASPPAHSYLFVRILFWQRKQNLVWEPNKHSCSMRSSLTCSAGNDRQLDYPLQVYTSSLCVHCLHST